MQGKITKDECRDQPAGPVRRRSLPSPEEKTYWAIVSAACRRYTRHGMVAHKPEASARGGVPSLTLRVCVPSLKVPGPLAQVSRAERLAKASRADREWP